MAGMRGDARGLSPQTVARRLRPVFKRFGIRRAVLFGSVARGEATRHSDVDLILVQDTDRRFLDRYDGLLLELNRSLPEAAVEPFIYTPAEVERMRENPFVRRALNEGVCVYESE
jgi:predicted nucleotidyltransferase